MKTETVNYIYLHHLTCFLSNFPPNFTICFEDERNVSDIENYGNYSPLIESQAVEQSLTCYNCLWRSLYYFDDENCVQGRECVGYTVLKVFAVLCILIGTLGTFTNSLIVIVLKRGDSCAPSLATLLLPLAVCDGVTSLVGAFFSIASYLAFENVNRSANVMRMLYISLSIGYYSRTTSMFLAVIITVERYCMVAKPLRAKEWFTVQKTKHMALIAGLLSLAANTPRWVDSKWTYIGNKGDGRILPHHKLPGYDGYPYMLEYSDFGYPFYDRYCELYFILDFLIPLPTLLFFNYMIYRQVRKSNSDRKNLQSYCALHQSEVNAAKMFAIVVVILVLSHILPIKFHAVISIHQLIHRDLGFACMLTIGINCSVNFVIYCAFGKAFRENFKQLLVKIPIIKQIRRTSVALFEGRKKDDVGQWKKRESRRNAILPWTPHGINDEVPPPPFHLNKSKI
ncbi:FMRFamide receptor [Orchesella cincta]|uniref:FMRFamide receptor n=1 Tax=Orchesella cincta TaxID=48709 RepID=A0A1D2M6J4_ORCCI|nr:FMRFamide receptor [Orchesella cincta]